MREVSDPSEKVETVDAAAFDADVRGYLAKSDERPIAIYEDGRLVMVLAGLAALARLEAPAPSNR